LFYKFLLHAFVAILKFLDNSFNPCSSAFICGS